MSKTWVTVLLLVPLLILGSHKPGGFHDDEGAPLRLLPAEESVLSVVEDFLAGPDERVLLRSNRLVQACRTAADAILADPGGSPQGEVMRAALEHAGVTDATTWPFTIPCGPEGPAADDIRGIVQAHVSGRPATHVGAGLSGMRDSTGRRLLVLLFVQRRVDLDPFPRSAAWGQSAALSGSVPEISGFPRVLLATPAGRVLDVDVYAGDGTRFWSPIPFGQGPGRYIVEVLSSDRFGPQVANLFPVYVGVPAPTFPEVRVLRDDPPGAKAKELEEQLVRFLNRDRKRFGVHALRLDARLRQAARAHSVDMARRDYFGHRNPEGELAGGRLERHGLAPVLHGEVICIATSAAKAHSDLMRSPSHRRAMLDSRMTHVGIGVIQVGKGGGRRVVVTEEFGALP